MTDDLEGKPDSCFACRGTEFWRRPDGHWLCQRCHPDPETLIENMAGSRDGPVVARQAHNLEAEGSNPSPATNFGDSQGQTIHDLKTWPMNFHPLVDGTKTFEFRLNDRNFKVGDMLYLHEWNHITGNYTGKTVRAQVTYILYGGIHGLPQDYCVMSIKVLEFDVTIAQLAKADGFRDEVR